MPRVRITRYDPRKDQDERMNQQAIRADEAKMRRVMGNKQKYRGSNYEAEHRGRGRR